MNREIKFRAWDKREKIMYEGSLPNLAMTLDGRISLLKSTPETLEWEGTDYSKHLIPLQYTGVRDKNGTEIYEGDVLECGETKEILSIEYTSTESSVVGFVAKYIRHECYCFHLKRLIESIECEVIGNIYENPELLEGENNDR